MASAQNAGRFSDPAQYVPPVASSYSASPHQQQRWPSAVSMLTSSASASAEKAVEPASHQNPRPNMLPSFRTLVEPGLAGNRGKRESSATGSLPLDHDGGGAPGEASAMVGTGVSADGSRKRSRKEEIQPIDIDRPSRLLPLQQNPAVIRNYAPGSHPSARSARSVVGPAGSVVLSASTVASSPATATSSSTTTSAGMPGGAGPTLPSPSQTYLLERLAMLSQFVHAVPVPEQYVESISGHVDQLIGWFESWHQQMGPFPAATNPSGML